MPILKSLTALFVLQCCQQSTNPCVGHSLMVELLLHCLTVREKGAETESIKRNVGLFHAQQKKIVRGGTEVEELEEVLQPFTVSRSVQERSQYSQL